MDDGLWDEFIMWMENANEFAEDFSEGAWFQHLEDQTELFLEDNGIEYDANSAVHEYLKFTA